jgi:3'-5' exoribonuclease
VARDAVPAALFSPASARPLQEMVAEFDAVVASMEDPHWRRLMEAFRSREDVFGAFAEAPAAKVIHHAWVGGLLEHSLSLARAATALAPNYPTLDRDLILCACFLHDAGKAREISSEPGFEYTTEGKLFGHIYMGGRLVESLCDGIEGFPEGKRRHLLHVVLSHQGERSEGFGSPVDPITPEAVFFHQIDNLDAKVQACLSALEKADGHQAEGEFTNARLGGLRKSYYRVRPEGPPRPQEPEQADHDDRPGPDGSPQPRLW